MSGEMADDDGDKTVDLPVRKRAVKKAPPRRPPTKKPRTRTAPHQKPESKLNPGDTLEFGISVAVRINGLETWVKVGGTTVITPVETYQKAGTRLRAVVERYLDGSVKSLEEALSS